MFIAQTMAAPSEEEEKEDSNTMRAEFNANADGAEAARQIKRTLKRETNGV